MKKELKIPLEINMFSEQKLLIRVKNKLIFHALK